MIMSDVIVLEHIGERVFESTTRKTCEFYEDRAKTVAGRKSYIEPKICRSASRIKKNKIGF